MACFSISINSKAMRGQTKVSIILPILEGHDDRIAEGEKFQTLWLLHGGFGDDTDYMRNTAIAHWAIKHKLAVIMPQVGNSFYSDMPDGSGDCFTYVTEELPALLRKYFPLSDKREDNFVIGLSMGGFGAAKIAFNYPDRYGAVGLMSTGPLSPLQLSEVLGGGKGSVLDLDRLFGGADKIPGSINDPWYLLEQAVKNGTELPMIYDCCGTEDFSFHKYLEFKAFAQNLGLDITFAESPGAHTWDFWNEYLPKIIEWLPLKNRNFAE